MPDVIEQRTKQELDRFKPKRKRTRPVDMRISRSSLGDAKPAQAQELLADQLHQKEPPSVPSLPSPPSVSKSLAEVEEPAHTTLNSASADAHVGEAEPDRSIEIDPDAQVSFANESIHSISRVPEAKPSSPPLAAAQSRSGDEMDAPFVPPADEPFDVPTEDSPVADERSPVSPLSAASSTGFSRAPRVKGPRVAQAAQVSSSVLKNPIETELIFKTALLGAVQ